MDQVTIAYAITIEHGKQIIGVAKTPEAAVNLIRSSGYGLDLSEDALTLLAIIGYTCNRPINFKLETWQVHS